MVQFWRAPRVFWVGGCRAYGALQLTLLRRPTRHLTSISDGFDLGGSQPNLDARYHDRDDLRQARRVLVAHHRQKRSRRPGHHLGCRYRVDVCFAPSMVSSLFRRTGAGRYVFSCSVLLSPASHSSRPAASMSSNVCPSTPGAPPALRDRA